MFLQIGFGLLTVKVDLCISPSLIFHTLCHQWQGPDKCVNTQESKAFSVRKRTDNTLYLLSAQYISGTGL